MFNVSRISKPAMLRGSLPILLVAAVCVVAQSRSDRYPIVKIGKVGFINSVGNEVIAPQFFTAGDMAHFQDGLAPVAGADGAGYIDASARFVIGPNQEWGQLRPFHEGIAAILIWGRNGALNTSAFIDQSGHIVFSGPAGNWQTYFSEGLMPLSDGTRWGFVDKSFRWVIAPKYDHAVEFSGGLAPVQVGRKWGYIDKTGNQIVSPAYDLAWVFSDGRGRVEIDIPTGEQSRTMEGPRPVYRRQFGFVDPTGAEALRPQFESATNFQQGRAFVIRPGSREWAIIDKQGNVLHQAHYEQTREFHEGLAAARIAGRWGYVDLEGAWAVAPELNNADDFWHGLARVAWKDGYGYIDRTGKSIWKLTTPKQPQK